MFKDSLDLIWFDKNLDPEIHEEEIMSLNKLSQNKRFKTQLDPNVSKYF
jgi:hypothetical protein